MRKRFQMMTRGVLPPLVIVAVVPALSGGGAAGGDREAASTTSHSVELFSEVQLLLLGPVVRCTVYKYTNT